MSPPCSPLWGWECWAPQIHGTQSHQVGGPLSPSPGGTIARKNPSLAQLGGESWGSPLGRGHIQPPQLLSAVFCRDISASQKDQRTHCILQPYGCWGVGQPVLRVLGESPLSPVRRVGGAPCPHTVQQDLRAHPFLQGLGGQGVTPKYWVSGEPPPFPGGFWGHPFPAGFRKVWGYHPSPRDFAGQPCSRGHPFPTGWGGRGGHPFPMEVNKVMGRHPRLQGLKGTPLPTKVREGMGGCGGVTPACRAWGGLPFLTGGKEGIE